MVAKTKMRVTRFGTKIWRNGCGKIHRDDAPAKIFRDGTGHWYKNGKLHRLDGPAKEYAVSIRHAEWWINGIRHRIDGPAVEYNDGAIEYWIDNVQYVEPLMYWLAVSEWKRNHV